MIDGGGKCGNNILEHVWNSFKLLLDNIVSKLIILC